MPELPEVETVVRELAPQLVGRRLPSIEVGGLPLRTGWEPSWNFRLVGRRVQQIHRRGKWIVVSLNGGLFLLFHLGMTGQLTVWDSAEPRQPHTHIVIGLDKGRQQLRFRDVRRFGCAVVVDNQKKLDRFFADKKLGPEPFELDQAYWQDRLKNTVRCLKAALLDQQLVAGIGNIYADEALFRSRLHPTQLGCHTSRPEAERLRKAIVAVLNHAIDQRGSSIRDYIGGNGQKGKFQREFRVYGRTGQPCVRCREPIEQIRLAGRSTHYCPQCQNRNQESGFRNQDSRGH